MLIASSVKSGSAHSVIKHLPLLDPVSDNSRALTFVFRRLFSNVLVSTERVTGPPNCSPFRVLPRCPERPTYQKPLLPGQPCLQTSFLHPFSQRTSLIPKKSNQMTQK